MRGTNTTTHGGVAGPGVAAGGRGRRSGSNPSKEEQTVAEIGKEYIHDSTVWWCR